MKYIASPIIISLVLILSGCTSGVVAVPKELKIDAASQDKSGMVFCSIGGDFSGQGLYFRAVGSASEGRFYYDGSLPGSSYDIREGRAKAGILFTRLPPGDYELVNVDLFANRGQFGSTNYSWKEKFSIPFNVTANEVTYLGAFMSRAIMGKTILGFPKDIAGYFVVSDHFERDLGLLKTKDASVENMPSKKMIPDPDSVQLPVFQSKVVPSE